MDFSVYFVLFLFYTQPFDTTELPILTRECYINNLGDTTSSFIEKWTKKGSDEVVLSDLSSNDSTVSNYYFKLNSQNHFISEGKYENQNPIIQGGEFIYQNSRLVKWNWYDSSKITHTTNYVYNGDTLVEEIQTGQDTGRFTKEYSYRQGKPYEIFDSGSGWSEMHQYKYIGSDSIEVLNFKPGDTSIFLRQSYKLINGKIVEEKDYQSSLKRIVSLKTFLYGNKSLLVKSKENNENDGRLLFMSDVLGRKRHHGSGIPFGIVLFSSGKFTQ